MSKYNAVTPNLRLRAARLSRRWSQQELAAQIGTTPVNVSRWERSITFPGPYYRQQLCLLFDKKPEELGLIPQGEEDTGAASIPTELRQQDSIAPAHVASSPVTWSVPYRRNPLFTGREDILLRLHNMLRTRSAAALTQAISGMGGIGKTQTALEYAYCFRSEYTAVLWARAETRDVLVADFVVFAGLLNLPEKGDQDHQHVIEAVKRWLKDKSGWLLILDNVEDFTMVSQFLPAESVGHILLTTRAQSTGVVAQRIDLDKMERDEGALLLLRRAKLIEPGDTLVEASDSNLSVARELAELLDGLPLALDQAGAYIEETGCSIANYLERYREQRAELLDFRGRVSIDHPQSAASTLYLSFERVEQANIAAADLLRFCAFLHPDAIPEEMILEGASCFSPVLQPVVLDALKLDATIAALRTYSLLRRNPDIRMLSLHRLVQAVLKDSMDRDMLRQWAETAVRVINAAFPTELRQRPMWLRCQRYLPHALVCAGLIDEWHMQFPEAADLLHKIGTYLLESGQYAQVEQFFTKARDIRVESLGAEHPDVMESLNDLAQLYFYQGRYAQAKLLSEQALAIGEKTLGLEHPSVAQTLNILAMFYHVQGKYGEAEPLYQQSLSIRQKALGAEHVDVAESLNNLAFFYYVQSKYEPAEPLYRQSLAIYEKITGPESPDVARSLNNLAKLYQAQGKYAQVESLYQRALELYERLLGPEHPHVAFCLNNLASVYHSQGKYAQAENLYLRALALRQKVLGAEHLDVATSLHNLAWHYLELGQYERAEPLYQQALAIREKVLGPEHSHTAQTLNDLGRLYTEQQEYEPAEMFYRRALTIHMNAFGPAHPDAIATRQALAALLSKIGRESEAEELRKGTVGIEAK